VIRMGRAGGCGSEEGQERFGPGGAQRGASTSGKLGREGGVGGTRGWAAIFPKRRSSTRVAAVSTRNAVRFLGRGKTRHPPSDRSPIRVGTRRGRAGEKTAIFSATHVFVEGPLAEEPLALCHFRNSGRGGARFSKVTPGPNCAFLGPPPPKRNGQGGTKALGQEDCRMRARHKAHAIGFRGRGRKLTLAFRRFWGRPGDQRAAGDGNGHRGLNQTTEERNFVFFAKRGKGHERSERGRSGGRGSRGLCEIANRGILSGRRAGWAQAKNPKQPHKGASNGDRTGG